MKLSTRVRTGLLKLLKWLFIVLIVFTITGYLFMLQKSFGQKPLGARLERLKRSAQFKEGSLHNSSYTPMMSDDASYPKMIYRYFFNKEKTDPEQSLPVVKPDLHLTPGTKPEITWFGHSSLFIQINNKNILVDPVFSARPSPVQFIGSKNYQGTDVFKVSDFPKIDYVFITHDHYDHLDYATILQLKESVKDFYCPLGVGSHLEYWGIDTSRIHELDWWDEVEIGSGLKLVSTPARHFSGRGIADRNKTLWCSYVLQSNENSIYLGGDSGYDTHFSQIGEKYGPFDIALLECGQYNPWWPYIHMMPEETAKAAVDLKAKVLQPIHWGKFTLALHKWDEPIQRVSKEANRLGLKLTTPLIGEKIVLDSVYPDKQWWIK